MLKGLATAVGAIGGLGTGVATALGVNVGSAGAFVVYGGAGAFTTLTASGLFTLTGVEDSLTAHAGGTQAAALQLSAVCNYHRVTVCATAADSVKFAAATVGQAHYLRNDGAAACQVFGAATETINGVASATGVSLPAGQGCLFYCTTAGAWTTPPGVGPITVTDLTSTGNTSIGDNAADTLAVLTNNMVVASTGETSFPRQSSFSAFLSAEATNATGDGTDYTVICNTEIQDRNADYNNGTGVYTWPVAGYVMFTGSARLRGLDALTTGLLIKFVATGQSVFSDMNFAASTFSVVGMGFSQLIYGAAGNTCSMHVVGSGTNKAIDIDGGANSGTYFAGALVC